MKPFLILAALALVAGWPAPAHSADTLRIALQKTGTVAWEIDLLKARGLDTAADLDLEVSELASTDAGKIAIEGRSADMIVSDWLWVARERSLGDRLMFTPYSSALGAVMVKADASIRTIADLGGRAIGVAGGPLDKSWLLLQGAAKAQGIDLAAAAKPIFGAPPLIAEKFAEGEMDAALEFWNFSADLESRGFVRAIDMIDVEKSLGAKGPVAMTGYVFSESFAEEHKDALKRFFSALAKARAILASDPGAWAPIKARLNLKDDAALEVYKKRYLDGAPKRPVAEEAADAKALYATLARLGGRELVGDATELDVAEFFDPAQ